jgi:hypothetical protein
LLVTGSTNFYQAWKLHRANSISYCLIYLCYRPLSILSK